MTAASDTRAAGSLHCHQMIDGTDPSHDGPDLLNVEFAHAPVLADHPTVAATEATLRHDDNMSSLLSASAVIISRTCPLAPVLTTTSSSRSFPTGRTFAMPFAGDDPASCRRFDRLCREPFRLAAAQAFLWSRTTPIVLLRGSQWRLLLPPEDHCLDDLETLPKSAWRVRVPFHHDGHRRVGAAARLRRGERSLLANGRPLPRATYQSSNNTCTYDSPSFPTG